MAPPAEFRGLGGYILMDGRLYPELPHRQALRRLGIAKNRASTARLRLRQPADCRWTDR